MTTPQRSTQPEWVTSYPPSTTEQFRCSYPRCCHSRASTIVSTTFGLITFAIPTAPAIRTSTYRHLCLSIAPSHLTQHSLASLYHHSSPNYGSYAPSCHCSAHLYCHLYCQPQHLFQSVTARPVHPHLSNAVHLTRRRHRPQRQTPGPPFVSQGFRIQGHGFSMLRYPIATHHSNATLHSPTLLRHVSSYHQHTALLHVSCSPPTCSHPA